jgi:NADH:ubiquinone oxidoreductase subunit 2 (subunit N)
LPLFLYGILDQFFIKNGDEIEFPLLVCLLALGVLFLLHVHTLMEFLLAIETVTLASYVFAGYERQNPHSTYASVQYFILGSIPSGMLVLSLSLLYAFAGILTFEDLDLFLFQNMTEN